MHISTSLSHISTHTLKTNIPETQCLTTLWGLLGQFNTLQCDMSSWHLCICECVWSVLTGNRGLGPTLASGMLPLPMPRASMLKVKAATPRPLPAIAAGLLCTCNTHSPHAFRQLHCQTRVDTSSCTTACIALCLTLPAVERLSALKQYIRD